MRTFTNLDEFARHESLLWRVLSVLARTGYFARPDDARDVVRDFYAEAWSEVVANYESTVAPFHLHVASSFYRFARPRLISMNHWHQRTADLVELANQSADLLLDLDLQPMVLQDRALLLRDAVCRLPDRDRQVLQAYLGEHRDSERRIAETMSLSCYSTRQMLASALGHIATLFKQEVVEPVEGEIAIQIWYEGRTPFQTARYLAVSVNDVQYFRSRFCFSLLASLRMLESRRGRKGIVMSSENLEFLRGFLLSDSGQNYEDIRNFQRKLRDVVEDIDDINLTDKELTYLLRNPEHLAKFYDLIALETEEIEGTETESEAIDFSSIVEQERLGEAKEIGVAFNLMTQQLPRDLLNFDRYFSRLDIGQEYLNYLASQPAVENGGPYAKEFIRFGMTPETIAEAARGIQILLDESRSPLRSNFEVPRHNSVGWEAGNSNISLREIVQQVATTPWLPSGYERSIELTRWLFNVFEIKPFFVRGYQYMPYADVGGFLYTPQLEGAEIIALWTR
jgi:hypothetical protein